MFNEWDKYSYAELRTRNASDKEWKRVRKIKEKPFRIILLGLIIAVILLSLTIGTIWESLTLSVLLCVPLISFYLYFSMKIYDAYRYGVEVVAEIKGVKHHLMGRFYHKTYFMAVYESEHDFIVIDQLLYIDEKQPKRRYYYSNMFRFLVPAD